MENDVGKLQEEALKRKQRLLNLKSRKRPASESDENEQKSSNDQPAAEVLPRPIFRSYKPQDEALKELVLPRAEPGSVEEKVKDELEAGVPTPVIEEVDLTNLAPRKPDWDLKRDVAKKLEKLEKRTQKAIAELIRDRLKQGKEELLVAVNAAAKANQNASDSDED